MSSEHRFDDEWLVPAAQALPGVSPELIEQYRAQGRTHLSQALIEAKVVTSGNLGRAVVDAHRVGYIEPGNHTVEKMAVTLVPEKICRRRQVMPLRVKDNAIDLAMANPLDVQALEDVKAASGRDPVPYYCLPEKVSQLITEFYSPEVVVNDILKRLDDADPVQILEGSAMRREDTPDEIRQPVTRLVNAMIANAVRMGASDIHLEHEERSSLVRFRIDGMIKNIMTLPRSIAAGPLVSRIKVMSDLDIANHRSPQDGRSKIKVGETEMALRVSTLPAQFGETVVIRILDPRSIRLNLNQLGIHQAVAAKLEWLLDSPQGMLLVTGPTGSGKTTTLYAMLNDLKSAGNNLVTVEDPVEYRLEGINQVQVKEKQGLGFASVLRSILRQDPDVIMVGEIRDRKTSEVAFQAAMTGHFVLSTLHTNDAFAAVTRLVDMGVERFKIAPALLGVTAQRLVRKLCASCKAPMPAEKANKAVLQALERAKLKPQYFMGRGCEACGFSGHKGRIMLVEFLEFNQALRDRVSAGDEEAKLRQLAQELRIFRPLHLDALWRLSEGVTSVDELMPYISPHLEDPAKPAPAPKPAASAQASKPAEPPLESVPPEPAAPGSSVHAPSPWQGRRILVADDDPAVRLIMRDLLQECGYRVILACDGAEALHLVTHDPPDMLVVDLNMPQLDGFGVIRGIRKVLGNSSLPVVVLTVHADDRSQEAALNFGADDYLIKPVRPPIVLARINALFRRSSIGAG